MYGNGELLVFKTGYDGVNCEHSIDECDYDPPICLNEGSCIEDEGSYQCQCGRASDGNYKTG